MSERMSMEDNNLETLEGFIQDPKTGLYMVYVNGELRGCAKDQVEAAIIYEAVRKC